MLKRLLVFAVLAWSLQALTGLAAASTLHVNPATRVRLLGTVESRIDKSGTATIDQIARTTDGWSLGTRIPGENDWQQTAVWYRFRVQRDSGRTAYALTWPGIIGSVDLYCEASNGGFTHRSGGFDAAMKSLTDHILIIPGDAYGHPCYARVMTGYYLSTASIVSLEQALQMQWTVAPALLGFFVAMFLFNIIMFVVLRQRQLLMYAGVVLTVLGVFCTDDTLWRYVHATPFVREFSHELFGWLFFAATTFFARAFLDLQIEDPKLDATLIVLVVLSALELVTGVLPSRPAWIETASLLILLALLAALVTAGVRAAARGQRGARFFAIGSAGACIGIGANIVVETFVLPAPEIVIELYALGFAWETLWLTVALADRMNEVAQENVALRASRAELEVLAELDPLTGVPNRRAFDEHLEAEWARALRAQTSLGVIMLDVDHFKEYNDTLGHVQGDLCLSKIAQACAGSLKRAGDFFARYGGEEFAAILTTQNDADLCVVAERMRAAVADLRLPHAANDGGIVTISLGVARMQPTARDNPLGLVDAADTALYAAKSRGRNQVGTALLTTS